MLSNNSKSYAELVVEYLVSATSSSSTPDLFSFSFLDEERNYRLIKWSAKKARGVLPPVLPNSGETFFIRSTAQRSVKNVKSRHCGQYLVYEERIVPSLLFFSGTQKAISLSPSVASYAFVTVVPYSVSSQSKNFYYLFSLFQKEIIHWCLFFFSKELKANEISEKRLTQRFPALLALNLSERSACLEEAVHLFSMNMLRVFNRSILLRSRMRRLPVAPLLTPLEMIREKAFERALSNSWMCCKRPVSEVLRAFSVVSKRIQEGYTMKSSLMQECFAIVLGVVSFAVVPATEAGKLVDYFNSFLFLKLDPSLSVEMMQGFRRKRLNILDNNPEVKLFLTAALQDPFSSLQASANDYSLNIYSLFTQAPEEELPFCDASGSMLRIDGAYKVEHLQTLPSSKACKISSQTNAQFILPHNNFEVFSLCVAPKSTDDESLSFDLRSIRKERDSEEEALAAIRARKRRRNS